MKDETKQALKKSAKDWADGYESEGDRRDVAQESYNKGAKDYYRDGVKDGYNAAIDAAIEFLRKDQNENYHGWVGGQLQYYETELEKLRKP